MQKISVSPSGYGVDVKLSFTNISGSRTNLDFTFLVKKDVLVGEESSGFGPAAFMAQNKGFIYGVDGGREEDLSNSY